MKNEFFTVPENTNFCKIHLVIPKSACYPEVVVNNHPEKQTVFANNEVVLGEALYAKPKTTGRTQTKEDKTIIVVDSILKGIQH